MADLHRLASMMRRALLRHRRLVAATSASAAAMVAVQIFSPALPSTTSVAVSSRDLAAGTVLTSADIRVVEMTTDLVPSGVSASDELVGETVAAPMRAGEPLTDRRVLAESMVAGYPAGLVAAPVRISDADVVALLDTGNRVDLYAASAGAGVTARRVVHDAPVVTLPQLPEDSRDGALIVLAVTPNDAARLAQASALTQLFLTLSS